MKQVILTLGGRGRLSRTWWTLGPIAAVALALLVAYAYPVWLLGALNSLVQLGDLGYTCIFVRDSMVVYTGSLEEIEERLTNFKPNFLPAFVRKLIHRKYLYHIHPDYIVVPGLADAHAHIIEYGLMTELPLAGAVSIQDVIQRVKSYIETHPRIKSDNAIWIEGMGWDHTKWPEPLFPTSVDLDQDPLLKDRLIVLTNRDCHAKWVSQRVMEMMGELPDDVDGGHIVRDEEGQPTGVFLDSAMGLIPIPPWTEERLSAFYETTMKDALSYGLTSIHDADSQLDYVSLFRKKAKLGELPIRLYLMGSVLSNEYWGSRIPHMQDYGKHERLTLRSVKLFADGELGSWSAALLQPYADNPNSNGTLATSPDVLMNFTHQFWKDGFQVNIHSNGDRATKNVLDAFERVLQDEGADVTRWRPRIEHARIISPEDLERIGRLGVIASVQPTHATADMSYAESRLGRKRVESAFVYRSLLQASPNQVLPLGSDFPVESMNPLFGFYAAVSRLDHDGSSPHGEGGWYPEQRLTRSQALKGMTFDAAYASFAEDSIGSLAPGKKADFVVLDRDIMTIPFKQILDTKVKATVLDGKVAYGAL